MRVNVAVDRHFWVSSFPLSYSEPEDVNCTPPQHHVSHIRNISLPNESNTRPVELMHACFYVRVIRKVVKRSLFCRTRPTPTEPSTVPSPLILQGLLRTTPRLLASAGLSVYLWVKTAVFNPGNVCFVWFGLNVLILKWFTLNYYYSFIFNNDILNLYAIYVGF